MTNLSTKFAKTGVLALCTAACAAAAMAAPVALLAQDQIPAEDPTISVYGTTPADISELPDGPKIEGIIAARRDEAMLVTGEDGMNNTVLISEATEVRRKGGFLGLSRTALAADALLNGLPVTVETAQWGDRLVAREIRFGKGDFKTASMIRTGTAQGFAEQTAATEALRGRVGDIDKYNIRDTTNVYFDTDEWQLSAQDESALCASANQAETTENALLLVVGYTDTDGSQDYNQTLSERRAGRVVNHLQQACGWKPWRMLTPTGMAEADPLADNMTDAGKAQNRRVAVNILVSKSVDGL